MRSFFPRHLSFLKQHPNSVFFVLFARKLGRYLGHPRQVNTHTYFFCALILKRHYEIHKLKKKKKKNSKKKINNKSRLTRHKLWRMCSTWVTENVYLSLRTPNSLLVQKKKFWSIILLLRLGFFLPFPANCW